MGTFRTDVGIENPATPGRRITIPSALVDTGAELSWIPATALEALEIGRVKRLRFRLADGSERERWAGFAIVHAGGTLTADEVVFAEPGDSILLGARTLEGLNLRVDPRRKELIDAGPVSAAAA